MNDDGAVMMARPRPARSESLGMALGLLGVVIFAGTLPFTRLCAEHFGPGFLTAARAALTGLAAAPVLAFRRRPVPWAQGPALALAAITLVVGFPALSAVAMRTLPAAHAGVLNGSLPLLTVVATAVMDGARPSRAFWACAVAGAAVVVAFALHHGGESLHAADALLMLGLCSSAVSYILCARLARRMPVEDVVCWIAVLCLPVALALSLIWRPAEPLAIPASAWGALLYLGLGSAFVGFMAWNAGLALGGVARVSQVQLLQTFLTIAVSGLLLGERIDAETVGAAALVVGLVALGRRFRAGG